MKKKHLKNFRELAARLPDYYIETHVLVSGAIILKNNPNAKGKDGEVLDPNATYKVKTYKPINHYRSIKDAYKKGGIMAVRQYTIEMIQATKNCINGQTEIISGMNERRESFSI